VKWRYCGSQFSVFCFGNDGRSVAGFQLIRSLWAVNSLVKDPGGAGRLHRLRQPLRVVTERHAGAPAERGRIRPCRRSPPTQPAPTEPGSEAEAG